MTETALVERDEGGGLEPGVVQLMIDLEANGMIGPTALTLTEELTQERWVALGRFFGRIHRSVNWWLGDWINHGEDAYGVDAATQEGVEDTISERYDHAQQVTGLDRGRLLNIASACRRVARSRRREALPFAIHEEVASAEPDDQVKWLDLVEEHGWSRSDLRRAMKGDDVEPVPAGDGAAAARMSIHEQIETASRLVWNQAQKAPDGIGYYVPAEPMAQLAAALGEE